MNKIEQVKERLSIFKNLYDVIRVIDPIKKESIIVLGDQEQELKGTCYRVWKKDGFCENCISMRAHMNNDTFIKLEYDKEKIVLITATPVEIDGNTFIVEILKDITKNGSVLHKLTESSNSVEELISSMNEKVVKDELTGLYNRRYINERLPVDINYGRISSTPISVIMTDIDYFKKVNDTYGHVIWDKILIDFAHLIQKSIRNNSDWVGRFGGEEFIIVLNDTEAKNAYLVAEKIRKLVESTTFNYDDININITSSFGVYSITDYDINILDLLDKVDKNLYKAKASGRNMTIISQEDEVGIDCINSRRANLSKLNEQIKNLREIFNEVCYTLNSNEVTQDVINISQQLDDLVVKYTNELDNKVKNDLSEGKC